MRRWLSNEYAIGVALALLIVASVVFTQRSGIRVHPLWIVALVLILAIAAMIAVQAVQFFCMAPEKKRCRLQSLLTCGGELGGWFVERDGRRVALLTDPQFEEMFWSNYAITPLVADDAERSRMLVDPAYWIASTIEFRSRELDAIPAIAVLGGGPFSAPGRLQVRGLYIDVAEPNLWESLLLWHRRKKDPAFRIENKRKPAGDVTAE